MNKDQTDQENLRPGGDDSSSSMQEPRTATEKSRERRRNQNPEDNFSRIQRKRENKSAPSSARDGIFFFEIWSILLERGEMRRPKFILSSKNIGPAKREGEEKGERAVQVAGLGEEVGPLPCFMLTWLYSSTWPRGGLRGAGKISGPDISARLPAVWPRLTDMLSPRVSRFGFEGLERKRSVGR